VLVARRCLVCDTRRWSQVIHREVVLLTALIIITTSTFFLTRRAAADHETLRREEASAWFRAATDGADDDARIAALRRAVTKDPRNREYRLALAQALIAGDHVDEARRTLGALWEAQPDDAETNLLLARVEARGPHPDIARRYFQSALADLWRAEQVGARRRVRLEFIDYLLARQDRGRALSELLALAGNLPPEPTLLSRVGRLLLEAGDPRRALTEFERAVTLDPANRDARSAAGEAAFESGDYRRAARYLDGVGDDARLADMQTVAKLVIASDPLAPRLSTAERRKRLSSALNEGRQHLDACIAAAPIPAREALTSLRSEAVMFASAIAASGRDTSDDAERGMQMVLRLEQAGGCEVPSSPLDRALVLIAHAHGAEES
jgi:Tfp pilus assembly protein PilF